MRLPRMSTGGWICTGLIGAAVLAPVSVQAVAPSMVALVQPGTGSPVSRITAQRQLMTTQVSPEMVVRAVTSTGTNQPCKNFYTPPAGKALMVTSVIYDWGSGTNGVENFGGLLDLNCAHLYDEIDGVQAYDTISRSFPSGVPMNGLAVDSVGGAITVIVYGYLIAASQLPAAPLSQQSAHNKVLSSAQR